jgi:hypothetical protein
VEAVGGGARWTGVRWSVSAWCEEKTEVAREWKMEDEKGELVGGLSPFSRMRHWLRAAEPVGGEYSGW